MKAAVVSYFKEPMIKELKRQGIEVVNKNPDVVIAFGGEGTFIFSESVYPGVPKLLIGHPRLCKDYGKIPGYIKKLKNRQYTIEKTMKIEASIKGRKLVGMNDINIHYRPPCALRFNVFVNNKKIDDEIIGDGVVISTPYGSSAYFSSITRKTFSKGIGIAFNNPVKKMSHIITNSAVKVKILRGDGVVACDCNRKVIPLGKGDVITVKKHANPARIIRLKGHDMKLRL